MSDKASTAAAEAPDTASAAGARAPGEGAFDAPEVETVTTTRVACDGGEGPLGHPRVWLTIPPDRGWVECGYCDKRYVLADG